MLEQYREVMIPTCFDVTHNRFKSSIHTWVIKTPRHVILIDSCGGNNKKFDQLSCRFISKIIRISRVSRKPVSRQNK